MILSHLQQWWDLLIDIGPSYGYFPNSRKTYLLVKPECVDEAKSLFSDTMVNITDAGHRYLGSVIGTDEYVNSFVEQKIDMWNNELLKLVEFADSQPHASFAALTHGLFGKWFFLARTTPNIAHLFQPLETTIHSKLLPVLLGQGPPNDYLRDLFSLPARFGGMGIINPVITAVDQHSKSIGVSQPLIDLVLRQDSDLLTDTFCTQLKIKVDLKKATDTKLKEKAVQVCDCLSDDMKCAVLNSSEKGASSWLTVVPLQSHNFALYKSAFRDAITLRYGWSPTRLPLKCVCGNDFTVEHALSCSHGGYPLSVIMSYVTSLHLSCLMFVKTLKPNLTFNLYLENHFVIAQL